MPEPEAEENLSPTTSLASASAKSIPSFDLKIECCFQCLLWEPVGIDVFGSLEHLICSWRLVKPLTPARQASPCHDYNPGKRVWLLQQGR